MKLFSLLFLFYCSSFLNAQQDIEILFLANWTYPQTFCDHGGPQDHVRLTIRNTSGTGTVLGNYIYLNYRIDGGAIIRDSLPALGGGSLWQFDFTNRQEDFSACGDTFDIETWVEYFNDPDQTNDTLAYQFINFCTPISGTLFKDSTYQNTTDLDTLLLFNSENATNYFWQYSLDSLIWQYILVNDTILPISYVDTLRYYRVVATNPECPTIYSNPVKIRFLDPTLLLNDFEDESFRIFPNPTSDIVHFSTTEKTAVTIYDINGRIMYSQTLKKGTHTISTVEWEKGVYFVKDSNRKGVRLNRIIKK